MRKRKTKKYKLPKYIQKKAESVNKIFESWKASGLTSNDLELAQGLFRKFYKDEAKKNVRDKEMASSRILVDKSQKEEYNRILDFVLSDEFLDLKERKKQNATIREDMSKDPKYDVIFNKVKSKYSQVNDEQSFMDFADNMTRVKNDEMLSMILSSDQIATLYGYGINKGFKESEIDKKLIDSYKLTGLRGSSMFDDVMKQIGAIRGKSVYQKTIERMELKKKNGKIRKPKRR